MSNNSNTNLDIDNILVGVDLANILGKDNAPLKRLKGIEKKPQTVEKEKLSVKEQKENKITQALYSTPVSNDLTDTQEKAIDLWIQGKDFKEIADEISMPLEVVQDWFNNDNIIGVVEETKEQAMKVYQNRIDALVPYSLERLKMIITNAGNEKVALMAIDKVLKASGLISSDKGTTNVNKGTQIIINSDYTVNNKLNEESKEDFIEVSTIELDDDEKAML